MTHKQLRSDAVQKLAAILSLPQLRPEHTGEQIGLNRLEVIERLSELVGGAVVQFWLVENRMGQIETRLSYLYPSSKDEQLTKVLRGQIVVSVATTNDVVPVEPPPELLRVVKDNFGKLGEADAYIAPFPVMPSISLGDRDGTDPSSTQAPLAWVFVACKDQLDEHQSMGAMLLAFKMAVLLEHGRSLRIVEAINASTEIIQRTISLEDTLKNCAAVLANFCAANGAGVIEFSNGGIKALTFAGGTDPIESKKHAIENLVRENYDKLRNGRFDGIKIYSGREVATDKEIGDFLAVPVVNPGFRLFDSQFMPISEVDGIGDEHKIPSYALFVSEKESPDYLGTRFSETDKCLCHAVADRLAGIAFSRVLERSYNSQTDVLSSGSLQQDFTVAEILKQINFIVPCVQSLDIVFVSKNSNDDFKIVSVADHAVSLPEFVKNLLLEHAEKNFDDLYKALGDGDAEGVRYCCRISSDGDVYLIFQMTTRYMPMRFYVLRLGTRLMESFRLQLLKQFMREMYLIHRAKDNSDERTSLLAQIRHSVIDPLAAAKNNIEAFHRQLSVFGRTDDGWRRLKTNARVQELIPQAIYLSNQALLFIDSGKFLVPSVTFTGIKFEQIVLLDLINDVHKAFEHGMRERAQIWDLKVIGDAKLTVVGDRVLLWMAIANLISNAIKYGHRETHIKVVLECRAESWTFTIENEGDYLPKDLAEKIFQPYQRSRNADSSLIRRHGTGLGLYVAQTVLFEHSPDCILAYESTRVERTRRALTRFTFTLPNKISRGGNRA